MIGQDDHVPALSKKLQTQIHPIVRSAIVAALEKIGTRNAVSTLVETFDTSKTIPEKVEIVLALGRSASPAAGEALDGILDRSEYAEIRLAAIEGLGATGDLRFLRRLEPFLAATSPELRFQSAAVILRLTRGVWLGPAD